MKRIYIFLLAAAFLGASCSEGWLDVNPSTSVPTDQALSTQEDLKIALNGLYRQTSQHSYYGDNHWYYGDCRATDVQARESKGTGRRVSPYYEYNVLPTDNLNITLPWQRPYVVIRQANNIIQRIEEGNIPDGTSEELARIKSEALVLRGLALFNLTRMFGMPYTNDEGASLGVPIVLKPESQTYRPERNTVAQCYNQVIEDLTDALPALRREKTDGFVNYWAAQALLSRVYLNKGDYEKAYDAAVEVIANNGGLYRLYTKEEYSSVWGQDFQAESLFELYITISEPSEWGGGTGGEGAPMVYANEGKVDWNNLILSEDFLNLLDEDADDVRHCVAKPSLIENNTGLPVSARKRNVFLGKFPGKQGDPHDNDICVIRLSEVYLNAAEAGLKLGGAKAEQGRTYLNDLIKQRTPNEKMRVNEVAGYTIDRIMKERRKELVGEGLIFFDYLRNKLPIERKGSWHLETLKTTHSQVIQHTDTRIALPIPQSEIDANPNMQQNPL